MAPVYRVSEGASPETQHYLLRFAAIPFGLATVLLAYAIVRAAFPGDRFLAVTVPAFVALQPQVSYEAAMVNNDIGGIAIYSLLLYLLVMGIRRGFSPRLTASVGFVLGAGLLIKSTTLTIVPIIAFAVIFGSGIRNVRAWLPRGVAIAGIAGLVSWPWYLFLFRTYGNFSALDQVAELQWAWTYRNRDKPSVFDQLFDGDFALMRWKETWGEFGWRLIHLNDRLLWAIGIPIILATAGLLGYLIAIAVRWRPGRSGTGIAALEASQVVVVVMMVLTAILAYFAVLQFGTRFSLTQSRYMFPAIIAFAFVLMLGLKAITPARAERHVQAAVVAALVLMNVIIYTQYVIPYWYLAS
jgi:4-amino-4-deoxy-L-arabinose transferase-like glycosyltransferase